MGNYNFLNKKNIIIAVIIILASLTGYFVGRNDINKTIVQQSSSTPALSGNQQTQNAGNTQTSQNTNQTTATADPIKICGIQIVLPQFLNSAIQSVTQTSPLQSQEKCRYTNKDNTFWVQVFDRDSSASNNQTPNQIFSAFDRYQQSNDSTKIHDFSTTPFVSTGIASENFYQKISDNSIGYSAQIFQDFPGPGVYQTVTKVDNRYLVYLTYTILENSDPAWLSYYNDRWPDPKSNASLLFENYIKTVLTDPDIIGKINGINLAAASIQ